MVETSFDAFGEHWDDRVGANGESGGRILVDTLLSTLGPVNGLHIYEPACGNGFLARRLCSLGASEVFASDISPVLINIAKTKYPPNCIRFLVQEASDFSGISRSHFDIVVVHRAIYYIKDVSTFCAGVYQILKPGGRLVFSTLHPLFPAYRKDIGKFDAMGEPITTDLQPQWEKYLHNYEALISSNIGSYKCFKRPVGHYIEACISSGLLIDHVEEVADISQSSIPSSVVLSAKKIIPH